MAHQKPDVTDLVSVLEREEFHTLIEFVESERAHIANWLIQENSKNQETLQRRTRYDFILLRYFAEALKKNLRDYAVFMAGALLGTVSLVEKVLFQKEQDQRTDELYQASLKAVRHLPEIILALETHGTMTHTELGKNLGMQCSTLTETMKKVLETDAVQVSKLGKYRMYSLTDIGVRMGRQLRRSEQQTHSREERLRRLLRDARALRLTREEWAHLEQNIPLEVDHFHPAGVILNAGDIMTLTLPGQKDSLIKQPRYKVKRAMSVQSPAGANNIYAEVDPDTGVDIPKRVDFNMCNRNAAI